MYIVLHVKYLLPLSDVNHTPTGKVLSFYYELFPILRFLNIVVLIKKCYFTILLHTVKMLPKRDIYKNFT